MGQPVVHFEITGKEPEKLRRYYGDLFGWEFDTSAPVAEAALQKAESLGGTRRMGPEKNPGANLVVGHFTDPEGHLIGLAGPM